MEYRIERDTLGDVKVPADKLWGAQTERSRNNFKIGPEASMPIEVIHSYAIIKKAAAITNHSCGILSKDKMELISTVCDEIVDGKHNDQFPLVVWQTGSGTQTNMNVNEVISNRCQQLLEKDLNDEKYVKANDDVNKSQSSNDTFPTAMHLAAYKIVLSDTIPAIENLKASLDKKSEEFKDIVKIGRTHMMDATPITLGQEFSAFSKQIENGIISLKKSLKFILEIARSVGPSVAPLSEFDSSFGMALSPSMGLNLKVILLIKKEK